MAEQGGEKREAPVTVVSAFKHRFDVIIRYVDYCQNRRSESVMIFVGTALSHCTL